jgi:hypothetical protein
MRAKLDRVLKLDQAVVSQLKNIVGSDRVSANPAVLASYSRCMYIPKVHSARPECVVKPKEVSEIQRILYIANNYRIPVYLYTAAQSDAWYPLEGGILLDLSGMNRILEINTEQRYAIIEPGVTQGQLWRELKKRDMTATFWSAPPAASMLSNCLEQGWPDKADTGLTTDNIICLEVVLPTGEMLRTGSAAQFGNWWMRYGTMPDLTGLFIGAEGTLGVVTKMGIRIFDEPEVREVVVCGANTVPDLVKLLKYVCKKEIGVGAECRSRETLKLFLHDKWYENCTSTHLCAITLWGDKQQVDHEKELLDRIVDGKTIKYEPAVGDISSSAGCAPSPEGVTEFIYMKGSRTCPCCWMPGIDPWLKVLPYALNRMNELGLLPTYTGGPAFHGRISYLRFFYYFDESDPKSVETMMNEAARLKQWMIEQKYLLRVSLANSRMMVGRLAGGVYYDFLKRIKQTVDPNNIMSPGHLGFSGGLYIPEY